MIEADESTERIPSEGSMSGQPVKLTARQRLKTVKAPRISGIAGLTIIVVAFLISTVNALSNPPNAFISMTLQPFIFVGLGLLLYHIGQHVHALNQNAILMVYNMPAAEDMPESG